MLAKTIWCLMFADNSSRAICQSRIYSNDFSIMVFREKFMFDLGFVLHVWWQLAYPCCHFYFDIKFGNRLYSKEKRRAWPMTMTGKIRYMPLLKSKQVSSRWWYLPLSLNLMRLWYINTFFCVGFHRVRGIQLDQIWVRL